MKPEIKPIGNKGMYKDLSVSKPSDGYAYHNHNIRLTNIDDNTLLSIVNEKGPEKLALTIDVDENTQENFLRGKYVGHAVISDYVVIFTTDSSNKTDYIYRMNINSEYGEGNGIILYKGDLNLSDPNVKQKFEALPFYESEDIQKVYWVDGVNQPRVINIMNETYMAKNNNTIFDFCPSFRPADNRTTPIYASIERVNNGTGIFQPGTIQYFITYYNKFAQETGVAWQSSLYYITPSDRAGEVNELCTCSFKLEIESIDKSFDYIRVYSAKRSTLNGQIDLSIVGDYSTDSTNDLGTLIIEDTNTNAIPVDPNLITFLGGQYIIADTMAQKDNVLFLGGLRTSRSYVNTRLEQYFESNRAADINGILTSDYLSFGYKNIGVPDNDFNDHSQSDSEYIKTFKSGEIYRIAIQYLNDKGQWSTPIWVGDIKCDIHPIYRAKTNKTREGIYAPTIKFRKPVDDEYAALTSDYISYRLLMADMDITNRSVVAQGAISPTLYNYFERYDDEPSSIASWNFRVRNSAMASSHMQSIGANNELQGITEEKPPMYNSEAFVNTSSDCQNRFIMLSLKSGHKIQCIVVDYNTGWQNDADIANFINNENNKVTASLGNVQSYDINSTSWVKARSKLINALRTDRINIPDRNIPTSKEMRNCVGRAGKWLAYVTTAIISVAGAVLAIWTGGASAAGAAAASIALLASLGIGSMTGVYVAVTAFAMLSVGALAATTQGLEALGKSAGKEDDTKKWELAFMRRGFFRVAAGKDSLKDSRDVLNRIFNCSGLSDKITHKNSDVFITAGPLTFNDIDYIDAERKREQYYIDESIVTLHSPDLNENKSIIENNEGLKFRIVGTIPISKVTSDYYIEATDGISASAGPLRSSKSTDSYSDVSGLMSDYLYEDAGVPSSIEGSDESGFIIKPLSFSDKYKVYTWNRESSLSLWGFYNAKIENTPSTQKNDATYFEEAPSKLIHKVFSNSRFSSNTNYFNSKFNIDINKPAIHDSQWMDIKYIDSYNDDIKYLGNYDSLVTFDNKSLYSIDSKNMPDDFEEKTGLKVADPIRIKYSSTEHAVIPFKKYTDKGITYINKLPKIKGETEDSIFDLYPSLDKSRYYICNFTDELNVSVGQFLLVDNNGDIVYKDIADYVDRYDTQNGECIISDDDRINKFIYEALFPTDIYIINSHQSDYSKIYTRILEVIKNQGLILLCTSSNNSSLFGGEYKMCILRMKDNAIYIKVINPDTAIEVKQLSDNYPDEPVVTVVKTASELYDDKIYNCLYNNIEYKEGVGFELSITDTTKKYVESITQGFSSAIISRDINSSISYDMPIIDEDMENNDPYVFIGELYRDIDYSTLYGGYSKDALEKLKWIPCSEQFDINSNIDKCYGDTYYQRWECLKTYPTTEQDKNSIVDILSFMVETRVNLEGRCDKNRGDKNILNARPTNFNIFNDVYSQKNNIFSYAILDEKYNNTLYKNQITWTLPKNLTDEIDNWTNISLAGILTLDGKYGSLTKLLNLNNNIIYFQDTAIGGINYNNNIQLATESGNPIEIVNSNRVTGYTISTTNSGCVDKRSICESGAGVYFIDFYNKSLVRFNNNGIDVISNKGFKNWFKQNITESSEKIFYDNLNNDVYIVNGINCLNFNEKLDSFISFYDYYGADAMFNYKDNLIAFNNHNNINNGICIYTMFKGDYGTTFDGNIYKPYSIKYKVNPDPLEDKIFTNVEFIADRFNDNNVIDDTKYAINNECPFDSLEVYNEYQYSNTELSERYKYANIEKKFRIWRFDIGRDERSKHKLDRIRNPWIYLTLKGGPSDCKMVMHSLLIKYFK